MKDVDCPFGIFLDLYVLDNLADGCLAGRLQGWEAWFWSKLLVLSCMEKAVSLPDRLEGESNMGRLRRCPQDIKVSAHETGLIPRSLRVGLPAL